MITREDCVKIGEVIKTHNLQGSVVITTDGNQLEQYVDKPVFLRLEGAPVPFFIAKDGLTVRNHTSYIVKFDYVDSQVQAERLVGCEVLLEKSVFETKEEEHSDFNIFELEGFQVLEELSGEVGKITEVADYSGNIVLTVFIFGKEILLPLSEHYITEVDLEKRQLRVQIPIELAELN